MSEISLPHDHGEGSGLKSILELLSKTDNFQLIADLFRQLGDTTRIRIFWLLCHSEECVVNIAAIMDMSSPAVSHHLRELKESGLIEGKREGKEVYYRAVCDEKAALLHKMIEKVMEITCPDNDMEEHTALEDGCGRIYSVCGHDHEHCSCSPHGFHSDNDKVIHEIHDFLLKNLDKRLTVEDLSRMYHINPTTLKSLFKSVYGKSLAAHIKEHRMEQAAHMLTSTSMSIGEIAQSVGYDSQSKFTAAFRDYYDILPKDYRKQLVP